MNFKYFSIYAVIVLFLLLFNNHLLGQEGDFKEYYGLTIDARNLMDDDDLNLSFKMYERAFALVETPKWYDIENVIRLTRKLVLEEESLFYSNMLAREFGIIPNLEVVLDTSFYDRHVTYWEGIANLHFQEIDSVYLKELKLLLDEDQKIRQGGPVIYKEEVNSDSLRTLNLLLLIGEHGFPTVKKVGKKGSHYANIILLHSDFDLNNELFGDFLLSHVYRGNMDPANYAGIIDRRCNFRGDKMYYY